LAQEETITIANSSPTHIKWMFTRTGLNLATKLSPKERRTKFVKEDQL